MSIKCVWSVYMNVKYLTIFLRYSSFRPLVEIIPYPALHCKHSFVTEHQCVRVFHHRTSNSVAPYVMSSHVFNYTHIQLNDTKRSDAYSTFSEM
jgi:hypothetical protein